MSLIFFGIKFKIEIQDYPKIYFVSDKLLNAYYFLSNKHYFDDFKYNYKFYDDGKYYLNLNFYKNINKIIFLFKQRRKYRKKAIKACKKLKNH